MFDELEVAVEENPLEGLLREEELEMEGSSEYYEYMEMGS